MKNGQVYRSGVIAAKQRAAQQGASRIEAAADSLLKLIDAHKMSFTGADESLILNAPTTVGSVASSNLPAEINGYPVKYAWKEMLPLGQYTDASGQKFTVTSERVGRLIANYRRAYAKGFKPFLPDHHRADSGSHNFGYVVDVRRGENGSFEGLHQLIGEDAHRAAARNRTSVMILKDVTDADGEKYDELLYHNALIPNPRLTKLKDFEPALAASSGLTGDAVVLTLAAPEKQGDSDMELLNQLRQLFGAADLTEEQAMEKVTALSQSHESIAAELKTAKANVLTLSAEPLKPSPQVVKLIAKNARMAKNAALKAGGIDAHVATELEKLLIGSGDNYALSLSQEVPGSEDGLAESIFTILAENKPVVLGESSRGQVLPNSAGMAETKPNVMDELEQAANVKK